MLLRGFEESVGALVFDADSRWVLAGTRGGMARRWMLDAGSASSEPVFVRSTGDRVLAAAFSTDGQRLVTIGSDRHVARWWQVQSGEPAGPPITLHLAEDRVITLGIAADGSLLAANFGDDGDGHLSIVEPGADQAQAIRLRGGGRGSASSTAFSTNGRWLATKGHDGRSVRVWELNSKTRKARLRVLRGHKGDVEALVFSRQGWLASGGRDTHIRLWDLNQEDPAARPLVLGEQVGTVSSLSFSPDGQWLASASHHGQVRIWNRGSNAEASQPIVLDGPDDLIQTIRFSTDNRWLAAGYSEGTARLWEIQPHGARPEPIIFRGHDDAVFLEFSPDSHWLATTDLIGTIRVWNLTTDRPSSEPRLLVGESLISAELIFSPDGTLLATLAERGVELWHLSTGALLDLAGATVGRNLSPNEWQQHFSGDAYRPTFPHLPIAAD
jgi:WD40 repeat protein